MPAKKKSMRKTRCAGRTKDGKRCNRQVFPPYKYCSLHKKRR